MITPFRACRTRGPLLLAVLALLARAWESPAQVHYGGEKGAVHVYSRTQEDQVRQTVGGQEQALDINSHWVFSARVVEATSEAVTFEIVHDSITITGLPTSEAPDFSAVYELPIQVVLGRQGVVHSVTVPESLPAAAARLDLETTYRTFFPRLPLAELEPGTAWVDTLLVTSSHQGIELTVRRVDSYTAGDRIEDDDRDGVRVDYVTALELQGSGRQQGAEVSLSGTGAGEGSFLFDIEAGLYLGGSESTEVRMDAFVAAEGQSLLIPIITKRIETVDLRD